MFLFSWSLVRLEALFHEIGRYSWRTKAGRLVFFVIIIGHARHRAWVELLGRFAGLNGACERNNTASAAGWRHTGLKRWCGSGGWWGPKRHWLLPDGRRAELGSAHWLRVVLRLLLAAKRAGSAALHRGNSFRGIHSFAMERFTKERGNADWYRYLDIILPFRIA